MCIEKLENYGKSFDRGSYYCSTNWCKTTVTSHFQNRGMDYSEKTHTITKKVGNTILQENLLEHLTRFYYMVFF